MIGIKPDDVTAAFRVTGMKPIRHRFINDKEDSCCALTAMAIRLRGVNHVLKSNRGLSEVVPSVLALTEEYWHRFVSGWNNVAPSELWDNHNDTPVSLKARAEGEASWRACVEDGLVNE